MSLNEILQIERERVLRERVVLTTVYDRMKNRINNSVRVKAKECIYTIPEFIPGYPLINVPKTMNYLLTKLRKEGFIAIQLTMLDLYITWDPVKIRQLNEQVKPIEPKRQEPIYSTITKGKMLWDPNEDGKKRTSVEKRLVEKEFERANEDFINSLIISKKSEKN
jgi:hypothetical protein